MSRNKDRLYVALFARTGTVRMPGREDKYHWAFIIAPKHESLKDRGQQIHVKNTLQFIGEPPTENSDWRLDNINLTKNPTTKLLVRILVAKIKSTDKLMNLLADIPIRSNTHDWNCVAWVQEGFDVAVCHDGVLGRAAPNWQSVRDTAMWYIEKKSSEGRFDTSFDQLRVPTWDALKKMETIN
ncbi:hypothetical protein CRV24_003712 [Beauveria bassiana]|nr:hypothetical protein CRV24_003712 [Beauveria bassiana]